eukprot:429505-Rhodomonas_salina.3
MYVDRNGTGELLVENGRNLPRALASVHSNRIPVQKKAINSTVKVGSIWEGHDTTQICVLKLPRVPGYPIGMKRYRVPSVLNLEAVCTGLPKHKLPIENQRGDEGSLIPSVLCSGAMSSYGQYSGAGCTHRLPHACGERCLVLT